MSILQILQYGAEKCHCSQPDLVEMQVAEKIFKQASCSHAALLYTLSYPLEHVKVSAGWDEEIGPLTILKKDILAKWAESFEWAITCTLV